MPLLLPPPLDLVAVRYLPRLHWILPDVITPRLRRDTAKSLGNANST